MNTVEVWDAMFDFSHFGELLWLFRDTLATGLVLGLLGGLIGVIVMLRDLAFAVHGIAELSVAGAAFALLIGADVVSGSLLASVCAAVVLGLLGARARERNSITGILMPFGLGLGILFLSLYQGRSANKFGLLTGQIVAVDSTQLGELSGMALLVCLGIAVLWRPLVFASVDAEVAQTRGIPVRGVSLAFMVLLGIAVALAVQVVGALLILALLITPAASALQVTSSLKLVVALSVLFAVVATVGGIMLALGGKIPISPYITTLSFAVYIVCRVVGGGIKKRRVSALARPM